MEPEDDETVVSEAPEDETVESTEDESAESTEDEDADETAEDDEAEDEEANTDIAADLQALASRRQGTTKESAPARRTEVPQDFASLIFQSAETTGSATAAGDTDDEDSQSGSAELSFDAPKARSTRSRRRATSPAGSPTGSAEQDEDRKNEDEQDRPASPEDANETGGPADTQDGEKDESGSSSRRRRRRGGRGRRGRGRGEDDRNPDDSEQTEQTGQGGESASDDAAASGEREDQDESGSSAKGSRSRSRGSKGSGDGNGSADSSNETDAKDSADDADGPSGDGDQEQQGSSGSRRRRRRRRSGSSGDASSPDDPPNTVVKVREARDEVRAVKGSTRLEAKKQRRREGRDQGRKRHVITEAEFLARRESVKRSMIVRERPGRTQIAVLEDNVLVEHYVAAKSQTSMVGNVYLGKVQNVLPSMEAAFVDIGRGRNAVLYAGEVNWDAAGLEGQPRRIELALSSGDPVLVQVTKDPIGHKGARLTSQISLPGRYVVLVPAGSMTGISRKLPDAERSRLKKIMKKAVPEGAGVIVRTAAEGASEEELTRDVERLRAQWEKIQKLQKSKSAPVALSTEPDLAIKVVRDVFNEDFTSLIVEGENTYQEVHEYVGSVAPDLLERVTKHVGEKDAFAKYRVDEQLLKAMDRKVYLPSGGSLVIDRTEAMTVIDVNTGKFTGSGGSLEETVTRNNLEAAEEIVRQLRLRDIGGIIVVDFIDMVLEANRDLVLRRLVECLGRDRTKHQVAEVTSLGLVQMTRKRVGAGLVETYSTTCEHCNGRGVIVDMDAGIQDHEDKHHHTHQDQDEGSKSSRRKNKSKGGKSGKSGKSGNAANSGKGDTGRPGEASDSSAKDDDGSGTEGSEVDGDVHRLEEDEDSRSKVRASIASIAAASHNHEDGSVTVPVTELAGGNPPAPESDAPEVPAVVVPEEQSGQA
jgi:ribonuclease E